VCCKLKCKLDKYKQNCVEAPNVSTGSKLCFQLCYFEILIYCITLMMMMTMMIHEARVLIRKSACFVGGGGGGGEGGYTVAQLV
jgi:hypothetical protein